VDSEFPTLPRPPEPFRSRWRMRLLTMSATLHIVSYFLPFREDGHGWDAFCGALMLCCFCPLGSPWWANPLYWLGACYLIAGRPGTATTLGFLAGIIALLAIFYDPGESPAYWVWLTSIVMLPFVAGIGER